MLAGAPFTACKVVAKGHVPANAPLCAESVRHGVRRYLTDAARTLVRNGVASHWANGGRGPRLGEVAARRAHAGCGGWRLGNRSVQAPGARRRRMRNSPTSSTSELNDRPGAGRSTSPCSSALHPSSPIWDIQACPLKQSLRTQVCLTSLRIALQVYDSFSKTKIIGWARPEDAPEPDQVHPAPWMI